MVCFNMYASDEQNTHATQLTHCFMAQDPGDLTPCLPEFVVKESRRFMYYIHARCNTGCAFIIASYSIQKTDISISPGNPLSLRSLGNQSFVSELSTVSSTESDTTSYENGTRQSCHRVIVDKGGLCGCQSRSMVVGYNPKVPHQLSTSLAMTMYDVSISSFNTLHLQSKF